MGTASNYNTLGIYGNGGASASTTGVATAITTTSTAAAAFGAVGNFVFDAIGCNVFIRVGGSNITAAAATTGNFDIVVPSGTAREVRIPEWATHFRAITDSGSGTLYFGRSSY